MKKKSYLFDKNTFFYIINVKYLPLYLKKKLTLVHGNGILQRRLVLTHLICRINIFTLKKINLGEEAFFIITIFRMLL